MHPGDAGAVCGLPSAFGLAAGAEHGHDLHRCTSRGGGKNRGGAVQRVRFDGGAHGGHGGVHEIGPAPPWTWMSMKPGLM
jgi:hypothetical protein